MLKKNLKRILMLSILFTIIISFNLIGASAADVILNLNSTQQTETLIADKENELANIGLGETFTINITGATTVDRQIKIPNNVKKIIVKGDDSDIITVGTTPKASLFNLDSATGLLEIKLEGNSGFTPNPSINKPSDFAIYKIFDDSKPDNVSDVELKYLDPTYNRVYIVQDGSAILFEGDANIQKAAEEVINHGSINVYQYTASGSTYESINLGTISNIINVNAVNLASNSDTVKLKFTIDATQNVSDTAVSDLYSVTIPSNAYKDNGTYFLVDTNKKYYAQGAIVKAIGTSDTKIYVDGNSQTYDLGDIARNVKISGNGSTSTPNIVEFDIIDKSATSYYGVTLYNNAWSISTPYVEKSSVRYHYNADKITKYYTTSGTTIKIYDPGNKCKPFDFGTLSSSYNIISYGNTTSNANITFGFNADVDKAAYMYNCSKTASGYYIDYTSSEGYIKYFSSLEVAKGRAVRDSDILHLQGSDTATFNLGEISDDLKVDGKCSSGKLNISYTSLGGTLTITGNVEIAGGVYLINNTQKVFYSNVAAAIEKIKESSGSTKYTDDFVLHITGSNTKVHHLGTVDTNLNISGDLVDTTTKAQVTYDGINTGMYLGLDENVVSTAGAYRYISGYRRYYGSLKKVYDAITSETGAVKKIYLDVPTSPYSLKSGADDWEGWTIVGGISASSSKPVTIDLANINYTTLSTENFVQSTLGQYFSTNNGIDRTYQKDLQAAVAEAVVSGDTLFLDENTSTIYNLGTIEPDTTETELNVGGEANIDYASLANDMALVIHDEGNLVNENNECYIEVDSTTKAYYNTPKNTIAKTALGQTYEGDTVCVNGDINLGTVNSNIVLKGVGDTTSQITYTEITGSYTLTLEGNADHNGNTGGVFTVNTDNNKVYYQNAIQAIVAEDEIYFEKMKTSTPYDLGDVTKDITCRSGFNNTSKIELTFGNLTGSIKFMKSDIDSGRIAFDDDLADSKISIYVESSKTDEEGKTYYGSLLKAYDGYSDSDNETLYLLHEASDSTAQPISKKISIIGVPYDTGEDGEIDKNSTDYPSVDISSISSSNVSIKNVYISANSTGISLAGNTENITIDGCVIADETELQVGTINSNNPDIVTTGVSDVKIKNNTFTNSSFERIIFDIDDSVEITDNIFNENATLDIYVYGAEHDSLTDEQKQIVSLLEYGNEKSDDDGSKATVLVEGTAAEGTGNYFLSFLKVAGDDIYEVGKTDFYKVVDTDVSSVMVEAEAASSTSSLNGGTRRYSKNVSLTTDTFEEFDITCLDDNGTSEKYTVHIYRQAKSSSDLSRTVYNDEELEDVMMILANTGSSTTYDKGIIYEAPTKKELLISKEYMEELEDKEIDLTVSMGSGFITVDTSTIPSIYGTNYKFITTPITTVISNPNDEDIILEHVDFQVVDSSNGRTVTMSNVVTGIDVSSVDFSVYDSSTIKVYYYNSSGTFQEITGCEYFVSEGVVRFTAPHYSEYVVTAQEGTAESNTLSLTATVVDTDDDPLSGYKVNIDGSQRTTNSAGEVTFSNLDTSSGSIQILDDDNASVFSGTYRISEGTSNTWSASNDNLVITHTSDVTTLDLLFEYVSSSNINITDVDFYNNPKTGFPFFTSTAGYITIALILAALVGLGFFVRKKFFLKQA